MTKSIDKLSQRQLEREYERASHNLTVAARDGDSRKVNYWANRVDLYYSRLAHRS